MCSAISRMAALAFAATVAVLGPLAAAAGEVSGVCRTSAYRNNAPPSSAPDICAAIETGGADGNPRVVDASRIVSVVAAAASHVSFVLLGEVHDNPSHHRVRARIIHAIADVRARSRRTAPGLVLEHVRADQAMAVTGYRRINPAQHLSAHDFFEKLGWKTSGWPSADLFHPMIEAAIKAEWPIEHGNLPRERIRAVARGGMAALDAREVKDLRLETPFPEILQSDLLDDLVESHCGLQAKEALVTMADAQRYRDAYMAKQLGDAARTYNGAVLLAGNGHVRADRGVPWHLRRMEPDKRILVVVLTQARADEARTLAYVERSALGQPIADYVLVTPRVERPDPCVAMRKRFPASPETVPK